MATITVQPNQSMSDVVLTATGSMEAANQFCVDNDVALSDIPEVGTVYIVSAAALALGNASALSYMRKYNIAAIATLGVATPVVVLTTEDGTVLTDEGGNELVVD